MDDLPEDRMFLEWCPLPERQIHTDRDRVMLVVESGGENVYRGCLNFSCFEHVLVEVKHYARDLPDGKHREHQFIGWEPRTKTVVFFECKEKPWCKFGIDVREIPGMMINGKFQRF